jgi:hypothetical protein
MWFSNASPLWAFSLFSYWQNFVKMQNYKICKWIDFGGFQVSIIRSEGKNKIKNHQISIFGSQCVVRNVEGWLKISIKALLPFSVFLFYKILPKFDLKNMIST